MPDINALLFKLIDEIGLLQVASLLNHDSTRILERWRKDGFIPDGKKFSVIQMLERQGYLK